MQENGKKLMEIAHINGGKATQLMHVNNQLMKIIQQFLPCGNTNGRILMLVWVGLKKGIWWGLAT